MKGITRYQSVLVNGDNRSQQIIFIFDEVMKLLYSTKEAISNEDHDIRYKNLIKIAEVFSLLQSGINQDTTDKTHQIMHNFYAQTTEALMDINIKPNLKSLDEIITGVSEIREAVIDIFKTN